MIPTLGIYGIQDRGDFPVPYWTHDHCAALFVDGHIEWAFELERYTRLKHDNRIHRFLEQLVEEETLLLPDRFRIVCVDSFVGRAFLSASGSWRIEGDFFSLSEGPPLQPARGRVGADEVEAFHCFHELAHIAANLPFTGGFEENSLLMHIDGGASQGNASAYFYTQGEFRHLYHGWDTVWPVLNFGNNNLTHSILGLDENARLAAPGQLMGYAAYGEDSPELRAWLRKHDWFRNHWNEPDAFFREARKEFGWKSETFDLHDPFLMNIAAACQAEFEDTMLSLVTQMQQKTQATQLYLAGGAALNVVLNQKLLASGLFDGIFIPPCCSDCGLAIGAAALAEFLDRGSIEKHTPFLNTTGLSSNDDWGKPLDIPEIANRLAAGQVVAFYVGAAEVGPRALGHRSLLASPADLRVRVHVSEHVKHRAWFRPVAPIVLEELAEDLFPGSTGTTITDYMLCNATVSPAWRERVPGIVHVDGSARVQIIRKEALEQETLRALLWEVWQSHQLPCLINTSFNGPGEPIVQTTEQAKQAAQRLGVDVLVINDRMMAYAPYELTRLSDR